MIQDNPESKDLKPTTNEKLQLDGEFRDYKFVIDLLGRHNLPYEDLESIGYLIENWDLSLPPWANISDARKLEGGLDESGGDAQIRARHLAQEIEQILLADYWDMADYLVTYAGEIIKSRKGQLFVQSTDKELLPVDNVLLSTDRRNRAQRLVISGDAVLKSSDLTLFIDTSKMTGDEQAAISGY